ncbi:hypothetical protein H671_3g8596 [Cricetulus griseus]|nr:hypothetical protein H671_3g8596 [Cricetulus griseus]
MLATFGLSTLQLQQRPYGSKSQDIHFLSFYSERLPPAVLSPEEIAGHSGSGFGREVDVTEGDAFATHWGELVLGVGLSEDDYFRNWNPNKPFDQGPMFSSQLSHDSV